MSKNFKYPLIVWLTTILTGSVLSIISLSIIKLIEGQKWDNAYGWEVILFFILSFSFIFTIPAWLIFWFSYYRITKANHIVSKVKWLLIIGQLLSLSSFAIFNVLDGGKLGISDVLLILSYCIALAFSTWFYFPKAVLVQDANEV